MKIIGIIPSRYKSSRFEGKPLADILGRPMVWWVYQQAIKVKELDEVIVATDDERIFDVCKKYDMNVIMTSEKNPTGTDRVVEVSNSVKADLYIVIMGDEPLIKAEDISRLVYKMKDDKNAYAGMLATKFKNPVDVINNSTIKLAVNDFDELIYMSRLAVPYPKAVIGYDYHKNVGVYAFSKDGIDFFKNTQRGRLESIEDMEMMRMLEHHKIVKVVFIDTDAMSVDTKKDLSRIIDYMKEKGIQSYE